jgi:uncharacterized membrane protein SpoIIM required for sporulation
MFYRTTHAYKSGYERPARSGRVQSMFDERSFVTRKQSQWQDLSVILERVKLQGLPAMPQGDLGRLGSLYRRTAADLAFARTQHATPELVFYLNELVGQGHGILYQDSTGRSIWLSVGDFFLWDLPKVLRKNMPFVLFAFFLTMAGAGVAYAIVHHNPADAAIFVPAEFSSSAKSWEKGDAKHDTVSAGVGALMSAGLMTHNISVGLAAFAVGITIVPPMYLMMDNGFILGALIALVQPTHNLPTLWAGILPHGSCELSAIFIDGGAGFLIGWSLIHPGNLSRREALLVNTKEACKMLVGTVPLYIVAGIIEGNVSHSAIPPWSKFALAGALFSMILFYIYGGWSRKPPHLAAAR